MNALVIGFFILQADEVVHEKYLPVIQKTL
jgi:hypothetical protein